MLIAMCLIAGFAVQTARPQATVRKGTTFKWYISESVYYESTKSQIVLTPSGNLLAKVTFQLDPDDLDWIPMTGYVEIPVVIVVFENGYYTLSGVMTITPDGKAVAVLHLKG